MQLKKSGGQRYIPKRLKFAFQKSIFLNSNKNVLINNPFKRGKIATHKNTRIHTTIPHGEKKPMIIIRYIALTTPFSAIVTSSTKLYIKQACPKSKSQLKKIKNQSTERNENRPDSNNRGGLIENTHSMRTLEAPSDTKRVRLSCTQLSAAFREELRPRSMELGMPTVT